MACARSGAMPLKSRATVSPRFARCTSIVPAPAIVDMNGSTTVIANAVATAASTALPPASSMDAPTRAPTGCSATTMPRGAGGVRFVTTSCEWITGDLGDEVLRAIDHRRVLEVDAPARRVHPGFSRVGALDGGPVRAGQLLHLGFVRGRRHRRTQH